MPDANGIRDPPETRLFFPAGWYNPRPTLSPMDDPIAPPATNYTVTNLDPYTMYEFKVTSRNSAGTTESSWISARTLEAGRFHFCASILQISHLNVLYHI